MFVVVVTCVGIKALGLRCVKSCWVAHRVMQPCLDCRGDKGGAGDGRGWGWGWGVVYQWPSYRSISTPTSTTSPQASRQRDAPTLNPAKTARASLESAILYCFARRGRGDKRRGREEALIAQLFTCAGIQGLSCAAWKVAGSAIVGCAAAALPELRV